MALWLVFKWREREPPYRPVYRWRNVSEEPCLTVTGDGVGAGNRFQYWLVNDSTPEPPATEKPPFAIPGMDDVRATRWNGRKVVSTFAGGGGSSTGYRMAGYRVMAAVEFIPAAAASYRANAADYTTVIERDVREVTAEELLEAAGVGVGELDLFDGSPPCEGYSTAGPREKSWGCEIAYSGTRQQVDNLFPEFGRLVDGIRPKVFVAENVTGLAKGRAIGRFKQVVADLRALGYRVQVAKIDSKWLGVPQSRERLIFVGVREDLGLEPRFPAPLPYLYTVRDALPHLARVVHETHGLPSFSGGDITDKPSVTVLSNPSHFYAYDQEPSVVHDPGRKNAPPKEILDQPCPTVTSGNEHSSNSHHFKVRGPRPDHPEDLRGAALRREWEQLEPGEKSERYFQLTRMDLDQPAPTVTAGEAEKDRAGATMPHEPRRFTIGELKAICGFPPDYVLEGSFAQQWERLGDAVPPLMARAIGEAVLPILEEADK